MTNLINFHPFPECPKCQWTEFSWHLSYASHMERMEQCPETFGSTVEHLDLTCQRCGYTMGMETADA